ncbi:MAG: hypothetical protein SGILL_003935 [Bacillariaceae sp.]
MTSSTIATLFTLAVAASSVSAASSTQNSQHPATLNNKSNVPCDKSSGPILCWDHTAGRSEWFRSECIAFNSQMGYEAEDCTCDEYDKVTSEIFAMFGHGHCASSMSSDNFETTLTCEADSFKLTLDAEGTEHPHLVSLTLEDSRETSSSISTIMFENDCGDLAQAQELLSAMTDTEDDNDDCTSEQVAIEDLIISVTGEDEKNCKVAYPTGSALETHFTCTNPKTNTALTLVSKSTSDTILAMLPESITIEIHSQNHSIGSAMASIILSNTCGDLEEAESFLKGYRLM